jgi:hypothetical protein
VTAGRIVAADEYLCGINEPFFGQDRIDLLIWRMESKGLTRRS